MKNRYYIYPAIIVLMFFCVLNSSFGQRNELSSQKQQNFVGFGVGLPYWVFGAQFGRNVFVDHLNVSVGVGYHIVGFGFNIGLKTDFELAGRTQGYLQAIYGTNAIIKIAKLWNFNKDHSELALGAGLKINSKENNGNYWDFGFQIPITSEKFRDEIYNLREDKRISDFIEISPILLVIGYNIKL